jgi:hypothetical protein
MNTQVSFYSLLYILDDDPAGLPNMPKRLQHGEAMLLTYLRMAVRLALGISKKFNERLKVVTNDSNRLLALGKKLGRMDSLPFDVVEINFPLLFPPGSRFRTASQKVELFNLLAETEDCYSVVLDLDMMCLARFPKSVEAAIGRGEPLAYDISSQVIPAYGRDVIHKDIEKLTHSPQTNKFCRWYGGEFIGGLGAFFYRLHCKIEEILPRYLANINSLHHQGDEALTTAGILLLNSEDPASNPHDIGPVGGVLRYWGVPVRHSELPMRRDEPPSFLHLPAKKPILSSELSDRFVYSIVRCNLLSRALCLCY